MPWPAGNVSTQSSVTTTLAAGRTSVTAPKATAADFAQTGLEPGVHIWVPHPSEVWRGAVVVGFDEAAGGIAVEAPSSGRAPERIVVPVRPKLPTGSPTWLRRNPELVPKNGALAAEDLGLLALLHEAELLHALQARFEGGVVYTYTGPMLLAVNPFRSMPDLYSYSKLRTFVDLAAGDPAPYPHVYGAARNAYQGVWRAGTSQTVLVSGESGAGKTETTKFVMRFLALAGAGGTEDSMSAVERRVLQAIPLLEALGNAKTLRNNNSSRFGKYTELQFGRAGERRPSEVEAGDCESRPHHVSGPRLAGAKTHCYLLEKVRVVGAQEGERSFHVFYQLLAAAERSGRGKPGTEEAAKAGPVEELLAVASACSAGDFDYLAMSSCQDLDGHDEAVDFDETVEAMRAFDMTEQDVADVLAAVLAVLHLGNIRFRAPANNSEGSEVVDAGAEGGALAHASRLLGVDPQDLEATLCRRVMKVKDERIDRTITQIRTVAQAIDGRDALARHLYGAVFAYAIGCINSILGVGQDRAAAEAKVEAPRQVYGRNGGAAAQAKELLPFVGVLDIFGFEFFECNSFEQLCINFTNELLQQYFNEVIFEHEADLYTREGVQWDPQDFPDNKEIVVLLAGEGKGSLSGVLPMLDEECNVTGGNAESWCRKLVSRYSSCRNFQPVKHRQGHFVIHHFAGPVEYDSEAFLAKNKDTLSADVLECMKGSTRRFVQQRFLENERSFGTKTAVSSGRVSVMRAKSYSVSSEFRQQLKTLMEGIRSTSPHFIRCIKPNPQSVPSAFHRLSVTEQLRYQGVLEAIQVSRAGYPVRQRHREAVLDFRRLAPRQLQRRLDLEVGRGGFAEAARLLFGQLRESVGLTAMNVQVGATQVFLKREAAEVLAAAKQRVREAAALRIQSARRRQLCMRMFAKAVRAVIKLQSLARALAARARCQRLREDRAALRLQSAERGRVARHRRRVRQRAVKLLQGYASARFQRERFLRLSRSTVLLQRWFRRVVIRARRKRVDRAAIVIQRHRRGVMGRRWAAEVRLQRRVLRDALKKLVARWRRRKLDRVRRKTLGSRAAGQLPDLAVGRRPSLRNNPLLSPPGSPPASPSALVQQRASRYNRLLTACQVGSVSSSDVAAATAVLERSNDALAQEAMVLQSLVATLQLRRQNQDIPMGLAGLFRCCYTRDVTQRW